MEPRARARGNGQNDKGLKRRYFASMEPRARARGNPPCPLN